MLKESRRKTGVIVLTEFFVTLLCVYFFAVIGTVGAGIEDKAYTAKVNDVQILNMSGVDAADGVFSTNSTDPWMVVNYDGGCVLHFTLSFDAGAEALDGRIYYADETMQFSEEKSRAFRFKNGENIIETRRDSAKIREDDAEAGEDAGKTEKHIIETGNVAVRYLRMDMGEKAGTRFKILALYEENALLYDLSHIPFFLVVSFSLILVIFYELLKRSRNDEKKTGYVFFALLCLSLVCIFGKFIFGQGYYIYTDIGADTFYQYYPYFVHEVQSIRNGTFGTWFWNYGMGTSILNTISWTLDPFGIGIVICGLVFGTGAVHYALVWMQILKILLTYLLCRRYIKLFCRDETAVCLGAFLCALNGYLLLWGQHYFLGTACIFILLLLTAVEKFVRSRGEQGSAETALASAGTLVYSYYIGYMILLTTAVYFVYRYFVLYKKETWKETMKIWGRCVFSVCSGMLLSGAVFVPACYYTMTNSSRLDGTAEGLVSKMIRFFAASFSPVHVGARLSRLLSNNLPGRIDKTYKYFSNYYETPQLFATIFIFFFAGQWLVYEWKKSKQEKAWTAFGVKMFLLYFLIFNSLSGLFMNAFVYASYRYTFVLFPLISLGIAIVWEKVISKGQIDRRGILAGIFLTACAWGYSYGGLAAETKAYAMEILILLLLGFAAILVIKNNKKYMLQAMSLFLLLIVASTALDSYITTNWRGYVKKEGYRLVWKEGELSNDTMEAIHWLAQQDTSFYRIDKLYDDWGGGADSFFEGFSTVTCYNSTLNKNVAAFYDHIYIDASDSTAVKSFKMDSDLAVSALSLANVKYIFSREPLRDCPWYERLRKVGDVFVYRNTMTDSVAKWYEKTITKKEFEVLSDQLKAEALTDTAVVEEKMTWERADTETVLGEFALTGSNGLAGTVSCGGKGLLMLAIPDQEGWSVYVDGKRAETYNTDYGFLGVMLDAGEHVVSAEYSVPERGLGILLSVAGLLMTGCLVLRKRIKGAPVIEN